jgi:2,3-bisphosphoglycerate-independent phosphoglycerate mutase
MSLLGYDPERYYTGRGPLEALGAGLSIREGFEVAFRANFATVDPRSRKVIDRRAGRSLTSEEARKLAADLDGLKLRGGEGYARVAPTVGHRAVVIIGSSRRLSDNVDNIDPAYRRRGRVSEAVSSFDPKLPRCKPLDSSPEAAFTCNLVDEFVEKSIEVLDRHPVNVDRERRGLLKANVLLLRDPGASLPRMPPISEHLGLDSAAAVAEMPVEIGIARAAGMKVYRVSFPSGSLERDLPERLRAALMALEDGSSLVYVHLKGPDEPGHDGSFEGKVRAIEAIDKMFVRPLLDKVNLEDVGVIVTSDHATPWRLKAHSSDPVPWMVSHPSIRSSVAFSERSCWEQGRRLDYAWQLLPLALATLGLRR